MKTLLLAAVALVALALVGGNGHSMAQDACMAPAAQLSRLIGHQADTVVKKDYTGAEAAKFMELINAVPPPTNYTADEVIIYTSPTVEPVYYVASFEHGCRNHAGTMSKRLIDPMIRQIEGLGV